MLGYSIAEDHAPNRARVSENGAMAPLARIAANQRRTRILQFIVCAATLVTAAFAAIEITDREPSWSAPARHSSVPR